VLNALAGSSSTPRCGCCRAAGGSSRWARPTSATPRECGHPGVAYRAFDRSRRPERIAEMLAELVALFERGALGARRARASTRATRRARSGS
jgi:hypothetical protein